MRSIYRRGDGPSLYSRVHMKDVMGYSAGVIETEYCPFLKRCEG